MLAEPERLAGLGAGWEKKKQNKSNAWAMGKRVSLPIAVDPFFFLLPALLLWLFVSGSRSCQSGSLSSFQTSPSLLLVLLNDLFQVFVAVAFDPVQIVTVQPTNIVTV